MAISSKSSHCAENAAAANNTLVRTAKIRWYPVIPTVGIPGESACAPEVAKKPDTEPEMITQYTAQVALDGPHT